MTCPKCGREAAAAVECGGCGLVFARYRPPGARPRKSRDSAAPSRRPSLTILLAVAAVTALAIRFATHADDGRGAERDKAAAEPRVTVTPLVAIVTAPIATPTPTPIATTTTASVTAQRVITAETVTEAMIRELEIAAAESPGDADLTRTLADAYAVMGERLHGEGKLDSAIPYYQRALARDPSADLARLLLAKALHAAGRMPEARITLADVGEVGRREPLFHVLSGELYYAAEDLPRALASYREASAIAADPALEQRIERIERELAAKGTAHELSSRRFHVYFDGPENAAIGRVVLHALERSYDDLRRDFAVADFTVPAILYPGRSYLEVTGAPDWSGGLYDGKIRLPVGGLATIDAVFLRSIKHELAHAFVARAGGNAVPRWLHEGLAQHHEGRKVAEFGLSPVERAALAGIAEPNDPRFFYAQALLRVEFLLSRYGNRKMLALLDAISRTGDPGEAIRSTLRVDPARLFVDLGSGG